MMQNAAINPRLRRAVYILLGLLMLIVLVLSGVQLWVLNTAAEFSSYGSIQADARGLPDADKKGAFLILKSPHREQYAGNLIQLLSLTDPGVVSNEAGAHLFGRELDALLVQSSVVGDGAEYQVYRLDEPAPVELAKERQPGGKDMLIKPKKGTWPPGSYVVDIPAEGMFGGRDYYQFYIDPEQ